MDSMGDSQGQGAYFLGTMIPCNREENKHEVIDGQQRLVALSVLLTVARGFISD